MSELLRQLYPEEQDKAQTADFPDCVEPMLAKLTHEHFSDPAWVYERKLDGERILALVQARGDVRLLSRNQKPATESYPEIAEALAKQISVDCVLDGEVVAFNDQGATDFQLLQSRIHVSDPGKARSKGVAVHYYLFDCPYVDGYDISDCSLRSRKKLLKDAVDWDDPIRWTPHRNEDGLAYFDEACQNGWEGLIAKQADSAYVHGRSRNWLKFKCVNEQEFVIGGFTDPKGERIGLGALLLGFYRDGDLVYAGRVGTGFDEETLQDLRSQLDELACKTSPYDAGELQGQSEGNGVHFVTPDLVCQVGFTEWTDEDKLRHPRYLGLRRDKAPKDVRKEA